MLSLNGLALFFIGGIFMYLGQAINYLNPRTVTKFIITAKHSLPEIDLNKGCHKTFGRYDLSGDILNHEVIAIDCIDGLVNFEVE